MRRHRRGQRVALGAALVLVGLGAAACGIPTGATPNTLGADQVPLHLLSPNLPPGAATVSPAAQCPCVTVPIFLVGPNGSLVAVNDRNVPVPADVQEVMAALLRGPTNGEAASGIATAIPPNVRLLSASVSGDLAVVDFNSAFAQLTGNPKVQAVSQIVYTLTAQVGTVSVLGVTSVQFEVGGQPVAVAANGGDIAGPLGRSDVSPTTTTTTAPPTTTTT